MNWLTNISSPTNISRATRKMLLWWKKPNAMASGKAPILQLRQHLQPELRALMLRHPQPQHFLLAFKVHAQHHVDRLVLHVPFVAHLHHQRIQILVG